MAGARYTRIDWYDTPLYYDIVFEADTALEGDFLLAMLERHASGSASPARRSTRPVRALEPACGSGRLIVELARRGLAVTGFDANPAMLAFARKRIVTHGLNAQLVAARLEQFQLRGRYDLAHCLVSTFKYLLDEEGARTHLESVARHLVDGGIYVLGFHLTDYAATSRNRERWVASRGAVHVVCNIQGWPADRRERLERVRSRLVITERGREKRAETDWLFRTYDAAQFRRLLRKVPTLEHVATYDFTYELEERPFDDAQLDCVAILRKTGDA